MKKDNTTGIKDRLVVALDVPDRDSALRLIESLSGLVGMYKVGLQLYTAEGPQIVREIVASGERVFLDLKFHDIPNTVTAAARAAARLGVSILDVHSLGGFEMMHAATLGFSETDIIWITRPAVLAVTILTSMEQRSLDEVGISTSLEDEVVRLAKLAYDSGLDGVVASPHEISLIRERVAAEPFIILTPGIRPSWSETGDQKRVATPAEAIRDGADFIVIGRAITNHKDPRSAAERVLEEIDRSL
ncbi:MAG TPA: orotidine-5'-phosphate decarboxylase [Blastocatellia bacterium]|nr:orotidine-5'-phosphate decarboxylase [Blastocatellia bacterium]